MSDTPQEHGDEAAAPPRRRRKWLRRAGAALLVLLLLALAARWGAGRRADKGLGAELAAYRAAGEPANVEELNRWTALRSGEGDNAVPLLRAAAAGINPNSPAWKAGTNALHGLPVSDAEAAALEALAAEGAESLALLDEAVAKPRIDWDPQYRSPVMLNLAMPTDLGEQRGLLQLAQAAALAAHRRGDDVEALRRVGQMVFIGRALDHQPALIYHLVALGCDAAAARVLAQMAPEIRVRTEGGAANGAGGKTGAGSAGGGAEGGAAPAGRVREMIAAMLDERPLAAGMRRAWVGERVLLLDYPNTVASGTGGAGTVGGVNVRIPGVGFVVRPWAVDNARVSARHITAIMRAMEASPDLPAYQAALAANDPSPEVSRSPRRYAMAGVLTPSLNRAASQHYRALASRRLAATCLAVRLYAVEHDGKLPEKLDDLVPAYLPSVPADPLAAGGATIRYVNDRTDPAKPRVYSVGLDGADDGGVEPPETPQRGAAPAPADDVFHLKRQPRDGPQTAPETKGG